MRDAYYSNESIKEVIDNLNEMTSDKITLNEIEIALLPLYKEAAGLFLSEGSRPTLLSIEEYQSFLRDAQMILRHSEKLVAKIASGSYFGNEREGGSKEIIESLREIVYCVVRIADINFPTKEPAKAGKIEIDIEGFGVTVI